jgi:adenylylsulfate kinase-like enzyme
VTSDLVPLLWLCGPPGVGKTEVGWELFTQLKRAGFAAGFVDIDQLGMCYPAPAADPGRHRMKAQNLAAVAASYQAAGARCVIVSGVVDPAQGVLADTMPRAALTICKLRADRDEIEARFRGRGEDVDQLEDVLREADALDASDFAGVCVDTSALPVTEVARRVLESIGGWPVLTGQGRPSDAVQPDDGAAADAGGPILLLCGATGAGKSTAGFEVYVRTVRAGLTAAYVDLDQIGFCWPAPSADCGNHRVKARNLAAMWRTFRAAGAQCLIATGPVEDGSVLQPYADALALATITLCRLHAGRAELTRRIMLRGQGGSWPQPGDPLRGQSAAFLHQVADRAAADADALEQAAIGGVRVDSDGLTVEETADLIALRTEWPGRRPAGEAQSVL